MGGFHKDGGRLKPVLGRRQDPVKLLAGTGEFLPLIVAYMPAGNVAILH